MTVCRFGHRPAPDEAERVLFGSRGALAEHARGQGATARYQRDGGALARGLGLLVYVGVAGLCGAGVVGLGAVGVVG